MRRGHWIALGAFILIANASFAQAQRPRGERLERLRNFGGRLLDSLENNGLLPAELPALDVPNLNAGLAELFSPLLSENADIEAFEIQFDPESTNLQEDRLGLMAFARLRSSSWSQNPSDLRIRAQGHVDEGPTGIVQIHASMNTDMLGLANFAIPKILDKMRSDFETQMAPAERLAPPPFEQILPPARPDRGKPVEIAFRQPEIIRQPEATQAPPSAWSADLAFREAVIGRLERTGILTDMDQLADLVTHVSALRFMAQNDELERLTQELAMAENEVVANEIALQLGKARAVRDTLLSAKPSIERDQAGRAVAIHFNAAIIPLGEFDLHDVEVHAARGKLEIKATLISSQGMRLYGIAKPFVVGLLHRIQTRDARALESNRVFLRSWMDQGRPYMFEDEAP